MTPPDPARRAQLPDGADAGAALGAEVAAAAGHGAVPVTSRTPPGDASGAHHLTERAELTASCRNCGGALSPDMAFCPHCGQETRLHPPSATEFVHEFASHYVALEGALWRTLKLLLFKPGALTQEYLRGRRRHYVLPLRLYISASFLFFLFVKGLGVGTGTFIELGIQDTESRPLARAQVQACASGEGCTGLESWVAGRLLRADDRGLDNRALAAQVLGLAPYAVFAMQPVFALLLAAAYRRRSASYGVHFVFSLHLHSLLFLGMLLIALLPQGPGNLVLLPMAAYAVLALHRVYGGSRWGTAWRALAVGSSYLVLLVLLVLALGVRALWAL
jgi:hypothetical protein